MILSVPFRELFIWLHLAAIAWLYFAAILWLLFVRNLTNDVLQTFARVNREFGARFAVVDSLDDAYAILKQE